MDDWWPWWVYLTLVIVPLVLILGFWTLWMWMDSRGISRPRVSRLQALQFVETHPQLRSLGDDDALTVARILGVELRQRERARRRFELALAVASLAAGAVFGQVSGSDLGNIF